MLVSGKTKLLNSSKQQYHLPPVLADAAAAAVLALAALPPVLADAAAAALLAVAAHPPVLVDVFAAALLAEI